MIGGESDFHGRLGLVGPEDFGVLQIPAGRTNAVGQARGRTPGTFLDLEFPQVLMGPAIVTPGLGFFSLGNGHRGLRLL